MKSVPLKMTKDH